MHGFKLRRAQHLLDRPVRAWVVGPAIRLDVGCSRRDADDVFDAGVQSLGIELIFFREMI